MAKLNVQNTAGYNAGKVYLAKPVSIEKIVVDPEFSKIFRISDVIKDKVRQKIERFGYSNEEPVVLWKEYGIIVDGHTRLEAAREAGLKEIPAVEKDFENKDEALLYTLERQSCRRNLSSAEILAAAEALSTAQTLPDDKKKNPNGQGRKAKAIGNRIGVSQSTVYQANAVLNEASEDDIKAIKNGEKTIKNIYNKIRPPKKKDEITAPVPARQEGDLSFSLSAAVILLAQSGYAQPAGLLISHFLRKNLREVFINSLPEKIRGAISGNYSGRAM